MEEGLNRSLSFASKSKGRELPRGVRKDLRRD